MEQTKGAGGGIGAIILVALAVLWFYGQLDHFLYRNGLENFTRQECLSNLAGVVYCGDDELGYWCRTFALNIPENQWCRRYTIYGR